MNKFIITEEEKNRILNLYEKLGDRLAPENLNSKFGQLTKILQTLLNKKYNLSLPTTGDFNNKEYNDKLAQYIQELGAKPLFSQEGNTIVDVDNKELTGKIINDLKKYNIPYNDTVTNWLQNQGTLSPVNLIQEFQDWLDVNKKGWATGYPNGILNKAKGYGKFGTRTKAAYLKYGKEFIDLKKNTLSKEEMTNLNTLINTLNSSYNQTQPTK